MCLFAVLSIAFQISQLQIGTENLTIEVAKTFLEKTQGLMNRDILEENQGMLFIYDRPQILSFWMKNTKLPLSIGFFDEKKKLLEIQHMDPHDQGKKVYRSSQLSQYALEVTQNWFEKHGIQPGTEFRIRSYQ